MKELAKKNWIFVLMFLGIFFVFLHRHTYLPMSVVSNPDSQIEFSTQDSELEQTWMPIVKKISGVSIPYCAENSFLCDAKLVIFNDDYSKVLVEDVIEDICFESGNEGEMLFEFVPIDVVQGERIRIQISLINESEEGIIKISSGSNYAGCSISGKKCGQAAAFTVTFVKYSKLFWIVSVIIPMFSFSFFGMALTKRKWEELVAVAIFTEGIVLYCFGLTEHLLWGLGAVYVFSFIAVLIGIWLYNKKNLDIRGMLSPGLWVFLLFFVIIILTSSGDWLGMRDELRHWGIAVRDMFYYDSFAKHANSTVILTRYIPFTALIEYAFVFVNGFFSEDILLIAYQTMLLSVLLILCKPLQKGNVKRLLVPTITLMICGPTIFFNNVSSSIMVDSLMAVIVAYALICYYSEKLSIFNGIRIAMALIALTLIKDVGLVLAGLTAFIFFGDIAIQQIKSRKLNIKELLYPILCVGLIVMFFVSWQFYLSVPIKHSVESEQGEAENAKAEVVIETTENDDATIVGASGISIEGLKNIVTGNGEWYQYQSTRNFIIELLEGETYTLGALKLSFVDLLLVELIFMVSLGYFGYWSKGKLKIYILAAMILISGAGLCLFIQITYWFSFGVYEAIELTSFDRYLAPYLCATLLLVCFLIYSKTEHSETEHSFWDEKKTNYCIYILMFALIIVTPIEGLIFESKDIEGNTTEDMTYGHDELANILRSVATKGERAYFICSNSDGYSEYIFRNEICPIVSEHEYWNIVSTEELYQKQFEIYDEGEINVNNTANLITVEEWREALTDCRYVVVFHSDELFHESYGEFFAETVINDGSVYEVFNEQGKITLQLIGTTGIKNYH